MNVWEERRAENKPRPNDYRTEWERDLSRITHSFAFRRLQGKLQVIGFTAGDFHRTRLTHSLEVAQIARGMVTVLRGQGRISKDLLPDRDLIDSICLAHDIGHPPFGHAGESALNNCLTSGISGNPVGFEGNGQTLRILSHLESHSYPNGLNLTRRTLLGILKYPVAFSKVYDANRNPLPKCYMDTEKETVEWILAPLSSGDKENFQTTNEVDSKLKAKHKSLDCSIMDIADLVSYAIHDFEDGMYLGLLDTVRNDERFREKFEALDIDNIKFEELFSDRLYIRKPIVGALVNRCITGISVEELSFDEPLLKFNVKLDDAAEAFLNYLNRDIIFKHIVANPAVLALEHKGEAMIKALFDLLISKEGSRLIPSHGSGRIAGDLSNSEDRRRRSLCDFIAGMTDEYLTRTYERVLIPRHGTIFDRL